MNGNEILDHMLGLVDHFKRKRDDNELSAGEAAMYLKCLAILGAKDAIVNARQMEALSDSKAALELPLVCGGR